MRPPSLSSVEIPVEIPSVWPTPVDLRALAQQEPQPPKFIIEDWLPAGYATLLAGHGGAGKSQLALQVAVAIALGYTFCGLAVERRRVLYMSCEDREDVLYWRLSRIARQMGISVADLYGRLDLLDLVGHDSVLHDSTGATPAYSALCERMAGVDVLVVDGVSDTFGGNENSRGEVKRFVNSLVALIPQDTGAVLLIGHVAKPAAYSSATSEGYSGSTSWHNSVRARWYLRPEMQRDEDGEAARTGALALDLQKSNLGQADQSLRFYWDNAAGLFIGQAAAAQTTFDRRQRDKDEQGGIISALAECAAAGIAVPTATTGRRTAYHVLSAQQAFPETLRGKENSRRFWRHIEALRAIRMISESSIRRADRHLARVLVLENPVISTPAGNAGNDEMPIARARHCGQCGQCRRGL